MSLLARLRAHVVDLTPLRVSRDFRLLFLGKSVSDFGDEIVAVAVPFQVYVITHSTLAVGLLGLCQLVPVFVFPIVGGAVADAVERRGLMLTTHVLLALMSLLMAFNAPFPQPDAALLAWQTAHDMASSVKPVLERWRARGGISTGVGFGLASGDAIIGNIGSPHYMNYTIIGDAVNVAARLVALAQPGELLISGAALRTAGAEATGAQPRGKLALRGRSEAVDVYAVTL